MAMLLEGVGEGGILTPPMRPVNHSGASADPCWRGCRVCLVSGDCVILWGAYLTGGRSHRADGAATGRAVGDPALESVEASTSDRWLEARWGF